MSGGSVAPGRAMALTYGLVVRQLVTRGRLFALAAVGVVMVIVAAAVGASDADGDPVERGVRLISDLGFTALVPIVALVFAAASLGDMREDGTLVYLWLRPMDRWPVVVGAWAAAVTVSLPLTVIPLLVSSIVVDAGGALVGATLLAAVVGTLVYSALFVLVGLLVKNAIVWGLAYVLLWEGLVAGFGTFAARLAIRGYTRSIITDRTGIDLDLGDLSLAAGVTVPLIVAVVAIAVSSIRLQSMEVA
ncbi:MAG: hypothetical protein AAF945_20480 [Actinomycetota bacterium]